MGTCHYCGPTDRELRPYGPGGSGVCYPCLTADPDRVAAAREVFLTLFEAAEAAFPEHTVILGEPGGPHPYRTPEDDR